MLNFNYSTFLCTIFSSIYIHSSILVTLSIFFFMVSSFLLVTSVKFHIIIVVEIKVCFCVSIIYTDHLCFLLLFPHCDV